jgi:hypothetical protein
VFCGRWVECFSLVAERNFSVYRLVFLVGGKFWFRAFENVWSSSWGCGLAGGGGSAMVFGGLMDLEFADFFVYLWRSRFGGVGDFSGALLGLAFVTFLFFSKKSENIISKVEFSDVNLS